MQFIRTNDLSGLDGLGIAITKYSSTQNHVAFIFEEIDSGKILLLHVGSHKSKLVDPVGDDYLWADLGCIHPLRRASVVASIQHIAKVNANSVIRYGLDHGLYCLDPLTGQLNQNYTTEIGFTCATFVIEVLLSQGIKIINWETWPAANDEDKIFQDKVLNFLARVNQTHPHLVTEEYLKAQRRHYGASRFKPQEIAIATQSGEPSSYDDVQISAQLLDDRLSESILPMRSA